jgi:hypothetical protein
VVISDYEAEDPLRLRVPEAVRFYKELDVHYAKVAEFGHRLSVFGIDFGPAENLPHDLKYMSPTIRVYGRN